MFSVVISSSPIPSNPSIEMIEQVILRVFEEKPALVVLVFDGHSKLSTQSDRCEWKSGRINEDAAHNYEIFKANVVKLLTRIHSSFEPDQPDQPELYKEQSRYNIKVGTNTTSTVNKTIYNFKNAITQIVLIEHSIRVGFALGVSSALDQITTDFVLINQHDWLLLVRIRGDDTKDVPIIKLLRIMEERNDMNYISFISRRSLKYATNNTSELLNAMGSEVITIDDEDFARLFFWYDRPHLARYRISNDLGYHFTESTSLRAQIIGKASREAISWRTLLGI